jgi:hypothetical protein
MTQGTQPASAPRPAPPASARPLRIGAIVAVAVAIALVIWLVVKDDNSDSTPAPTAPPATAASVAQIRDTEGTVGHTVYWAGRRAGLTYELTNVKGNVFIRYLPSGVGIGDPRPNFLTVGTYPKPNALKALERLARRPGSSSTKLSRGGLAVWADSRPQSVYFAYPGADVQIEVYDPSGSRARRLVRSGRVKPIS